MEDWTGVNTFEYDLLSQLKSVTDHKGNVVSYTYDGNGNKSSVTYPDDTTVTYTYDGVGNLTSVTESDGRTTTYTYDGMGRLVKMEYPHGWVEEYEYDAVGQLVRVTDSDPSGKDMKQQKHVYEYDACGNLIYEYMRGNGTGEATIENTYTYDALHRLTGAVENYGNQSRSYPGGSDHGTREKGPVAGESTEHISLWGWAVRFSAEPLRKKKGVGTGLLL